MSFATAAYCPPREFLWLASGCPLRSYFWCLGPAFRRDGAYPQSDVIRGHGPDFGLSDVLSNLSSVVLRPPF